MRWSALVSAVLIAGCATGPAPEFGSAPASEYAVRDVVQTGRACVSSLDSDPRFQGVVAKLRAGAGDYASPGEAGAVSLYADGYFRCQQNAINSMSGVNASLLAPLVAARKGATARYRALAAGQVTYAEAATQARTASETLSAELRRTWLDHASRVQAAEEQRARENNFASSLALLAAGAAMAHAYQPLPVYQAPLPRTVQTTCQRIGDFVNCQSY